MTIVRLQPEYTRIDVRALRDKLKMSIKEFSDLFGFNKNDIVAWERNELKAPAGSNRILLILIDKIPDECIAVAKSMAPLPTGNVVHIFN